MRHSTVAFSVAEHIHYVNMYKGRILTVSDVNGTKSSLSSVHLCIACPLAKTAAVKKFY